MQRACRTPREIDILTAEEVRALLAAASSRSATGVRNRAIVALLFGSGLRIGEALALRMKDLDLERLVINVQAGKGGRRRTSALFADAAEVVRRWLDWRAALQLDARAPVFCTLKRERAGGFPTAPGHLLSREYVAALLRRLARRAGIGKRVHPHGFRHSHAVALRERGLDVLEIQSQLGHADLRVTSEYLQRIGGHRLGERLRALGAVIEPAAPREELAALLGRLGDTEVGRLVEALRRALA